MKATENHRFETIADLLKDLGGISARRVRANPLPGTATEKDLIAVNLVEVRLLGVPLHWVAVPDLLAHLRVVLHAQFGDEPDAGLVRLGH